MEAPAAEVLQYARGFRTPDSATDMLRWESHYTVDADGRATLTGRQVHAIWTEEGVRKGGSLGQEWATWHQERPSLRARVIAPDGEVHVLDPSTLSEVPLGDVDGASTDRRAIKGPLPGLVPGAVVEFEFTRRDLEPLLPGGMMKVLLLRGERIETVLRIEVPERVPLRWVAQEIEVEPRDSRSGGIRTVEWRWTTPEKGREPEPLEPGRWEWGPLVAFSTAPSWSRVAGAYAALAERQLEGADLAAVAREIAGKARSRDEAATLVLEWMRTRFRYTALELGAHAIVPARPAEVMARRYGDCKDLSLLFVGLMRALGHPAHLALLRAGTPRDGDPELPGLEGFDHAIARVEGTRPLYVDPTFPWTRPGELPPGVDGRLVLVVREGQARLERIPAATTGAYTVDIEREYAMDDRDADVVRERRTMHGVQAARARASRPAELAEAEKAERGEAEKRLQSKEVTTRIEEAHDGALEQWIEAKDSKLVRWNGDDEVTARVEHRMLRCLPEALLEREGSPRTRPLDNVVPCAGELRHVLRPPPGFRVVEPLPQAMRVEVGAFRYAARFEQRPDGAVSAWSSLHYPRVQLSPEHVNEIRAELASLDEQGYVVKFERRSAKLLAAGRGREAIEELRAVAAASGRPEDLTRLAYGLSALGLNDAAVAVAREAASAGPGAAYVQAGLAGVLASDPLGRFLGRGCDHPGAVAAQRKAVALDDANASRKGRLGWLLLRGEGCSILGEGSALAEGVGLLEAAVKAGASNYSDELLFGLLASGRAAEALAVARKLDDMEPWRTGGLIAAVAGTDGLAAAAAEAGGFAPEDRTGALRAAARRLALHRKYALAADLLERGSAGAKDRQGLLDYAATFRRAAALAGVSEGSPQRAILRWLAGQGGGDAPPLQAPGRPTEQEAWHQAEMRDWEGDLSPALAAELELAFWDATFTEAAGGLGRLVSRRHDGVAVYLAREGGGWRVLALGNELPQLAWHTLGALRKGDEERGRVLAAWLREDAVTPEGPDEDHPSQLVERLGAEERAGSLLLAAALAAAVAPDEALAVLEPAAGGPLSPRVSRAVKLALARARLAKGEPGVALALLDVLVADDPNATSVQAARLEALVALGREAEALAIVEAAARPGVSASRLRRLADTGLGAGLGSKVVPYLEKLAGAEASANDLNNLAWARLFARPVAPAAVSEAQRAVDRAGSAAQRHTLASVLAATGEPVQAVRELREAVSEKRGLRTDDWLVVGLAAEALGLERDAIAAYRRVEAGSRDPRNGSRGLATGRLRALGAPLSPP